MGVGFITDNEIDRILGRMDKKQRPAEEKPRLYDRYNISEHEKQVLREDYSKRKAMEFTVNKDFSATGLVKMSTFTNTNRPAGIIRKSYAFFADLCLSGVILVGFIYASILAFGQADLAYTSMGLAQKVKEFGGNDVVWWMGTLYALILFFYFIFFEGITGKTPGKMFLNVRIIDKKGEKPSFINIVFRTLVFLIPPLGVLGAHNLLTGTKVVNNE
ncbi:MAG TPA: RDD family protein [bacterium]|nr:RDD family protein [bacterium]